MFDQLLKFSKTHAQTVIVALLGIVVVGGIGGGLLIQSLQETISEQKSLYSDRLQLATARDSIRLTTIEGKQEGLTSELSILRAGLPELVRQITTVKERVFLIPLDKSDHSKELTEARVLVSTLNDNANSLTNALASADAVRATLDKVESRWEGDRAPPHGGHGSPLLVIIFFVAIALSFLVGRASRSRRRTD